jgi:hypothetical protein
MLRKLFIGAVALLASSSIAAAAAKDDVQAAVRKLADSPNYTWTTTTTGGGFGGGASSGKTQKDGATTVSLTMRQTEYPGVIEGPKAAVKTADGWKSASELTANSSGGFNADTFAAMQIEAFKTPTAQAKGILDKLDDVQKTDDGYTATLSADAAKELLTFRRPAGGAGTPPPPQITDPKATIKLWITDGMLSKVELHLTATINFNGTDNPVDRTITTEIKDVGTTKVEVPADAQKAIDAAAPATKPA